MKKTQSAPDGMTVSAFAAMMSCDRHELARKISELQAVSTGTKNGGKLFTMRDLVLAFAGGDERAERIRKTRAEAERLELQNQKSRGEFIEVHKVGKFFQDVAIAIRKKILAMPITPDEQDALLRDLQSLNQNDWSE